MCGGVGLAGLMLMQVLSLRDHTRTQDNGPFLHLTGYVLLTSTHILQIYNTKGQKAGIYSQKQKKNLITPTTPHSPGCLLP